MKRYYVYFMENEYNTALYVGVTGDLKRRVEEHKNGLIPGFTKHYRCTKLVYYEEYSIVHDAIVREKQLKKWRREWKDKLIDTTNKDRRDLAFTEY